MVIHITPNGLLNIGLAILGRGVVEPSTQMISIFKAHYGCSPSIVVMLLHDLQTTDIHEARVEDRKLKIEYILLTLYFLRLYPTEVQLAATFKIGVVTVRTWIWFYIPKFQALKANKVCLYPINHI